MPKAREASKSKSVATSARKNVVTKRRVEKAQEKTEWDLANRRLYELCKEHPKHETVEDIVAKTWLIGRAYSAAIERGVSKEDQGSNFYCKRVASALRRSRIDKQLDSLPKNDVNLDQELLEATAKIHESLVKTIARFTKTDKRSFASKYLHFHSPDLFFLYDTRAVRAMGVVSKRWRRARNDDVVGDKQYWVFAKRCMRLQHELASKYKVTLTPRQLDNLLLFIDDKN